MEPDQAEFVVTEEEEERPDEEASREEDLPESQRIQITTSPRVTIKEIPQKVPEVSGRTDIEHQIALEPSGEEIPEEPTHEEEEPVYQEDKVVEENEDDSDDVIIVREEKNASAQRPSRVSQRERRAPSKLTYKRLGGVNQGPINYAAYIADAEVDSLTYHEAVNSEDSALWKEAIDKEMASLKENNTWELVDLPPGRKAIGSKWVIKIKDLSNGEKKYKARLVAKRYS